MSADGHSSNRPLDKKIGAWVVAPYTAQSPRKLGNSSGRRKRVARVILQRQSGAGESGHGPPIE